MGCWFSWRFAIFFGFGVALDLLLSIKSSMWIHSVRRRRDILACIQECSLSHLGTAMQMRGLAYHTGLREPRPTL